MQPTLQNLILRRPLPEDLSRIQEIASKYENHPLPDNFVSAAVIEISGDIKAFGVIRNHCELLLYSDGGFKERGMSLKELMEQAFKECRELGITQVYLYAEDESFARILESHFGFSRSPFIPMFKDL